MAKFLLVEQGG